MHVLQRHCLTHQGRTGRVAGGNAYGVTRVANASMVEKRAYKHADITAASVPLMSCVCTGLTMF